MSGARSPMLVVWTAEERAALIDLLDSKESTELNDSQRTMFEAMCELCGIEATPEAYRLIILSGVVATHGQARRTN
jgi:hypothetical protein